MKNILLLIIALFAVVTLSYSQNEYKKIVSQKDNYQGTITVKNVSKAELNKKLPTFFKYYFDLARDVIVSDDFFSYKEKSKDANLINIDAEYNAKQYYVGYNISLEPSNNEFLIKIKFINDKDMPTSLLEQIKADLLNNLTKINFSKPITESVMADIRVDVSKEKSSNNYIIRTVDVLYPEHIMEGSIELEGKVYDDIYSKLTSEIEKYYSNARNILNENDYARYKIELIDKKSGIVLLKNYYIGDIFLDDEKIENCNIECSVKFSILNKKIDYVISFNSIKDKNGNDYIPYLIKSRSSEDLALSLLESLQSIQLEFLSELF